MTQAAPLAISTGDPGGVGPEVALQAVASECGSDRVLIFGDARALRERALAIGIAPERVRDCAAGREHELAIGAVGLVDVGVSWRGGAGRHAATAEGGAAQLAALDAAIAAAASGRARALVTAPMSKAAVNRAGHDFIGHTEHLARAARLADDDVTMMFLGPTLRVALATTHVSIADLPQAVTRARVLRTIAHLAEAMLRLLPPANGSTAPALRGGAADSTTASAPRIVVTGLNPHAGESGLFGDEEPRAIAPAIEDARALPVFRDGRLRLDGPIGAETAFRQAASREIAGVVAMAHDQATIASKLLDWTLAVNVTWGLPFVRTSVDHGVAYDAAAAGTADPRGMASAIAMAQRLTALERG